MAYHSKVNRDPYWLESRYDGVCAHCLKPFRVGERIFYYPNVKKAYSGKCAEEAAADFDSCRFDEAQYTGTW